MPPGSAIIYTSSVNAYDPSVNLLDYAMTKAAIANFSKGPSKQMIKRGIRVNAVALAPFGQHYRSAAGRQPRTSKSLVSRYQWGGPGNPRRSRPSTFSLRLRRRAT